MTLIKISAIDWPHSTLFALRNSSSDKLLNFITVLVHRPVSFEEVGFCDILPPDSCLDTLSGHAAPEQRDVLRVRRLESCVLEDPETVS